MNSQTPVGQLAKILILAFLSVAFTTPFATTAFADDNTKPNAFEIRRVLDQANTNNAGETIPFATNDRPKPEAPLRVAKEILLDQSQVPNANTRQDPASGRMEIQIK